jgi:hypothetical protein
MRRWIAVTWHTTFFVLAAALYFFFVLPRWFELTGVWTPSLGTPLRIVTGLLVGLSALPVVFTWLRTRKPEFGTPQLALSLRLWSVILQVVAGVLIVGAAIAEIWLSLDKAGQWLFGIYGAAAALAVLGLLAFHLAYVAELPPPPPRPIKLKSANSRRGRKSADDEADETQEADETLGAEGTDEAAQPQEASETIEDDEVDAATEPDVVDEPQAGAPEEPAESDESDPDDAPSGKLKNRRPGGKATSRFRRKSGGVALDE